MAGLRKAQKEMTRRLLLSTALDLFQVKGYAATTIDEIAASAGTTRVTFYAYFPSRVDLMKALMDELNELLDRTSSPTHGSTAASLVDVVQDGSPERIADWLYHTSQGWDLVRPYTRAMFEAASADAEIRTVVDAWLDEAIGDIEEGLEKAGRFAPESRRLRGVLAITQLDHVARNWTPGRWNADRDAMLDALAASWIALICPAPA